MSPWLREDDTDGDGVPDVCDPDAHRPSVAPSHRQALHHPSAVDATAGPRQPGAKPNGSVLLAALDASGLLPPETLRLAASTLASPRPTAA